MTGNEAGRRGRFITFEGIEGVGKSTNMGFVQRLIESANIECVTTREPGGTPLAEEIRALLLANREERVAEMTELLLMFAARAQHVDGVIEPALTRGAWVLCDRFTDSTVAYQGAGRGVDRRQIEALQRAVLGRFQPDLTIWLDAPVSVGIERTARRRYKDRFESEQLDFFGRVRGGYEELASRHPDRIVRVDAARSLDEVEARVAELVRPLVLAYRS